MKIFEGDDLQNWHNKHKDFEGIFRKFPNNVKILMEAILLHAYTGKTLEKKWKKFQKAFSRRYQKKIIKQSEKN